ncbi:Amyloid-beta A4 precursor protein-binding family A member 2, partial [Geodia barretti]
MCEVMNQDEGEPVPSDSQPESVPDGRGVTKTMENEEEKGGVEEARGKEGRGDNDNVKNEGGEGEGGDCGKEGGHKEGEGEEERGDGEGDGGREEGEGGEEGGEGDGDGGREEGEGGEEGGKEEEEGRGGGGISSVEEKKNEDADSERGAQLTVDTEDDKEVEKKQEEVEEGKVNRTLEEDSKEIEGGGEGEGREEDSPMDKERKASKDQLLKSAGIQLTDSSESDITGAPLRTSDDTAQDRNLEQFSEILLDSDSETGLSLPEGGAGIEGEGPEVEEGGRSKPERRVRFADEVMETTDNADSRPRSSPRPETLPTGPQATVVSPRSSGNIITPASPRLQSPRSPSAPHTHEEIIAGVNYSAEYMGSTPIILTGIASAKTARMHQAQQVVKLFKDPENDVLPRFPVTIRISSQSIKIVDSTAGIDLMDHPLYTISYVADIENVLVIMINRIQPPAAREGSVQEEEKRENEEGGGEKGDGGERMGNGGGEGGEGVKSEDGEGGKGEVGEGEGGGEEDGEEFNGLNIGPIPRMTCHVLETNDARHVAMVIGQAFSVAYKEFLRATGISEEALEQAEYAHILNAQTAPQAELDLLRDRDKIRQLNFAKHKGDVLGLMVVESGYGSALPTPVIAHLSKTGSAARSGQLNVGDHIIAINGVNMVGMPVKVCIEQLKVSS